MRFTFLSIAFVMCVTYSAAQAQSVERGNNPCRADAEKLCKGVQPGEGRIIECMKKNESQLSPACKTRMEEQRGRRERKQ